MNNKTKVIAAVMIGVVVVLALFLINKDSSVPQNQPGMGGGMRNPATSTPSGDRTAPREGMQPPTNGQRPPSGGPQGQMMELPPGQ